MLLRSLALVVFWCASVVPCRAEAPAAELEVRFGSTSRTLRWDQLRSLPVERVKTKGKDGAEAEHAGPLLQDVLAKAGVALRGPSADPELRFVVVAFASDGGIVAFGAGECDRAISGRRILLAPRALNPGMSQKDGDWRIVVEGDARGTRSMRLLTRLEVRDAAQKATSIQMHTEHSLVPRRRRI